MNKYNKGFAPIAILLIILGVLAVGGVAYKVGKNAEKNNQNNQNMPTTGSEIGLGQSGRCPSMTPTQSDWANMVPQIRIVFAPAYKGEIEQHGQITASSILKVGDITGDCTNEALVDLQGGGAYVESEGIAMYDNGNVIVPKVKLENGETSYVELGDGASVRHQESGGLIDGVGYYQISRETDDVNDQPTVISCKVSAYRWILGQKMFEYNQGLTNQWQTSLCGGINPEEKVSNVNLNQTLKSCLVITSPQKSTTVTFPLTVKGYIDLVGAQAGTCARWGAFEGVAGNVFVQDIHGTAVSQAVNIKTVGDYYTGMKQWPVTTTIQSLTGVPSTKEISLNMSYASEADGSTVATEVLKPLFIK